ncbi:hypothetical protein CYMTET_4643 [Cymbomonas tetramitiformis]|uniref:Bacterial Ig-like domain-containing protein n=1 Tax=Cymbomonas tetramitiformis TaxID=36881 RepID=A0AAE0H136_9CHLO|nr:hypothetical protein CYMTET_4643 [Cymbomonas tetramitiformis]
MFSRIQQFCTFTLAVLELCALGGAATELPGPLVADEGAAKAPAFDFLGSLPTSPEFSEPETPSAASAPATEVPASLTKMVQLASSMGGAGSSRQLPELQVNEVDGHTVTSAAPWAEPGDGPAAHDEERLREKSRDDFDPGTLSMWEQVSAGTVSGECGAVSGRALCFGGVGTRLASTQPMNTISGGVVRFSLYMAHEDGIPADVLLEFKSVGKAWTVAETYSENTYDLPSYSNPNGQSLAMWDGGSHQGFVTYAVMIPQAAYSAATKFRWRQTKELLSGTVARWGLDDVAVDLHVDNPAVLLSHPNQEGLKSNLVMVAIQFSQPVDGFEEADVTVQNGTVVTLSHFNAPILGTGALYTAMVRPEGEGKMFDIVVHVPGTVCFNKKGHPNLASNTLTVRHSVRVVSPFTSPSAGVSLEGSMGPQAAGLHLGGSMGPQAAGVQLGGSMGPQEAGVRLGGSMGPQAAGVALSGSPVTLGGGVRLGGSMGPQAAGVSLGGAEKHRPQVVSGQQSAADASTAEPPASAADRGLSWSQLMKEPEKLAKKLADAEMMYRRLTEGPSPSPPQTILDKLAREVDMLRQMLNRAQSLASGAAPGIGAGMHAPHGEFTQPHSRLAHSVAPPGGVEAAGGNEEVPAEVSQARADQQALREAMRQEADRIKAMRAQARAAAEAAAERRERIQAEGVGEGSEGHQGGDAEYAEADGDGDGGSVAVETEGHEGENMEYKELDGGSWKTGIVQQAETERRNENELVSDAADTSEPPEESSQLVLKPQGEQEALAGVGHPGEQVDASAAASSIAEAEKARVLQMALEQQKAVREEAERRHREHAKRQVELEYAAQLRFGRPDREAGAEDPEDLPHRAEDGEGAQQLHGMLAEEEEKESSRRLGKAAEDTHLQGLVEGGRAEDSHRWQQAIVEGNVQGHGETATSRQSPAHEDDAGEEDPELQTAAVQGRPPVDGEAAVGEQSQESEQEVVAEELVTESAAGKVHPPEDSKAGAVWGELQGFEETADKEDLEEVTAENRRRGDSEPAVGGELQENAEGLEMEMEVREERPHEDAKAHAERDRQGDQEGVKEVLDLQLDGDVPAGEEYSNHDAEVADGTDSQDYAEAAVEDSVDMEVAALEEHAHDDDEEVGEESVQESQEGLHGGAAAVEGHPHADPQVAAGKESREFVEAAVEEDQKVEVVALEEGSRGNAGVAARGEKQESEEALVAEHLVGEVVAVKARSLEDGEAADGAQSFQYEEAGVEEDLGAEEAAVEGQPHEGGEAADGGVARVW